MRQPALSEPGFHPRAVETSSFSPRRALLLLLLFLPWIHGAPKEKARFGWCAGKHPARKPAPAQSGYVDRAGNRYCKACFREKFPALYKAKQSGRKKTCQRCGDVAELAGGFCKPCKRRYKCTSCPSMCPSEDPALWCTACFSTEERARQCCVFCVKKFPTPVCRVCLKAKPGKLRLASCVNSDCSRRFHVCAECEVPLRSNPCVFPAGIKKSGRV